MFNGQHQEEHHEHDHGQIESRQHEEAEIGFLEVLVLNDLEDHEPDRNQCQKKRQNGQDEECRIAERAGPDRVAEAGVHSREANAVIQMRLVGILRADRLNVHRKHKYGKEKRGTEKCCRGDRCDPGTSCHRGPPFFLQP